MDKELKLKLLDIEDGDFCPYIKDQCVKTKCRMYKLIQGHNPNTGQPVDKWDCAHAWLPLLAIENSQMQRQTGAAVESFRNEMVRQNEQGQDLMLKAIGGKSVLEIPE